MQSKQNDNDKQSHGDMTAFHLSHLGWCTLILSLASEASAFHSSVRQPFAMVGPPGAVRETGTDVYGRNNDGSKSPFSHRARDSSLLLTRLQYSDGNEELAALESLPTKDATWWNSLFPNQPEIADHEQDTVDEYLVFLDRRYRRMRSTEKEEETPKPFSAINWLMEGTPKSGDVLASLEEDALYVLGVAGLASHKLLQKHRLLPEESNTATSVRPKHLEVLSSDAIDIDPENDSPSNMFIKMVVVPVVRILYVVQRRKDLFVNAQIRRARSLLYTAARVVVKSLMYGPLSTAKAILEIGGGKQTMTVTLTVATTVFLLLRPVLKAAVTEGSYSP
jgi:hypothetical protein